MRVLVVGGGILGLASARLLAQTRPDCEVTLVEKEPAVARHQSARNSGVLHTGLYYAPGSLKARLCRRGAGLMSDFCAEQGIPLERRGKLVVAVREAELGRLRDLAERGAANGVPGLRELDSDGLRTIEPHVRGLAALHCPQTAVLDYALVCEALRAGLQRAGGEVRCGCEAVAVEQGGAHVRVALRGGEALQGDRAIVCAGLQSDRLARASGEPADPRIVPFRGAYWILRPERAELVRGLVYPVPDPGLPFLGVHLTRRVDGSVWVGPNAVLALAREGYRRGAFAAADAREALAWEGTRRMIARHWRAGAGELSRALSRGLYAREARRYVPSLRGQDLRRGPVGVRAQAVDRDGTLLDDFRLGAGRRVVWARNAPSPAATSALAIAEELVGLL